MAVKRGYEVEVFEERFCDMCRQDGRKRRAEYDAKTVFGSWAYLCDHHFLMCGLGRLGVGYGQRLIYRLAAEKEE